MEIFKIVGIGIATAVAMIILKTTKPEIATLVGVAGGIIIILMVVNQLTSVLQIFKTIAEKSGLSIQIFGSVLKIVGIGYITEFAASICNDSGSSSLADKILLAGKIIILVVSLPIITNIISIVAGLLP
ncbi:MAG: stage III sporulation protein AD [Clostridia bacterium]